MGARPLVLLLATLLATSCASVGSVASAPTPRGSTRSASKLDVSAQGPGSQSQGRDAASAHAPDVRPASASSASEGDGSAAHPSDASAAAEPPASGADDTHGAATDGWASAHPSIVRSLQSGRPLVVAVVVPLCSNEQISCGSPPLGNPSRLETNLYWGALYGARRFFDRTRSGWELVDVESRPRAASPDAAMGMEQAVKLQPHGQGPTGDRAIVLERAVYRRSARAARWERREPVELVVVLEAVHGQAIDAAVDRFWWLATRGGEISFRDGGRLRRERVLVVGYAGHNRLLDGKRLPEPLRAVGDHPGPDSASTVRGAPGGTSAALPSFVLACLSERFFGAPLRRAGADTLLTTGALMAPEGYVIDAVVRAIGDNAARDGIRTAAMEAAMRWQGLGHGDASRTFIAPAE